MAQDLSQKIQVANLVEGLSLAIDIAENKPLQHSKAVTFLSLLVGEKIGLTSEELDALYYAGLLHDIAFTSKDNVCPVCEAVQEYGLSHLVPSLLYADTIIHYSKENWDSSGSSGILTENIPLCSRLLTIITSIEDIENEKRNFWGWRERVIQMLQLGSGNRFDPKLVSLLIDLLSDREFSLDLFDVNFSERIRKYQPLDVISVSDDLFKVLGKSFALFIDNKSQYTANHSQEVANVAMHIAQKMDLSETDAEMIHLAGLLHDLGKVAIPNTILEKPGNLTQMEYDIIKNHPFYTALIISKIPELQTIGVWASAHHERLDGSGYYLGMKENELTYEARLIAVADVYAALAADRPYRKGMQKEEIEKVMQKMVDLRHLDGDIVAIALDSVKH